METYTENILKNNKDNVVPKDKWEFNESVADCFENMLERSIPQYDVMRESVVQMSDIFLQKSKYPLLVDIGCSDGLMIQRFYDKYGDGIKIIGVDVSEPMLNKAKKRFSNADNITIKSCDLRNDFPIHTKQADVITSILSIQFIPIEYRQDIIQEIYNKLKDGGSFIFVEKVLGETSEINRLMVSNYYEMKSKNGYSRDSIERKRLSLEGVLVPCTSNWNIELLKQAGFRKIDTFWRWMNFAGYIAIK